MAGPLEVLLRPEGRKPNAPEDARERSDLFQPGLCQVRRQAQASTVAVKSEDTGKIAEMLGLGETVTKKCNEIVGKFQTSESNFAKQQWYAAQNQKLLIKEIKRVRKSNSRRT